MATQFKVINKKDGCYGLELNYIAPMMEGGRAEGVILQVGKNSCRGFYYDDVEKVTELDLTNAVALVLAKELRDDLKEIVKEAIREEMGGKRNVQQRDWETIRKTTVIKGSPKRPFITEEELEEWGKQLDKPINDDLR